MNRRSQSKTPGACPGRSRDEVRWTGFRVNPPEDASVRTLIFPDPPLRTDAETPLPWRLRVRRCRQVRPVKAARHSSH